MARHTHTATADKIERITELVDRVAKQKQRANKSRAALEAARKKIRERGEFNLAKQKQRANKSRAALEAARKKIRERGEFNLQNKKQSGTKFCF